MKNKTKADAFRFQATAVNQVDQPIFPCFMYVQEKIMITVYKSFENMQNFQSVFLGKITYTKQQSPS
jgi:hypothetical protein